MIKLLLIILFIICIFILLDFLTPKMLKKIHMKKKYTFLSRNYSGHKWKIKTYKHYYVKDDYVNIIYGECSCGEKSNDAYLHYGELKSKTMSCEEYRMVQVLE